MPEVLQDDEYDQQQPLPPADLGPEVPDFTQTPALPVTAAPPAVPMVRRMGLPRPPQTVTVPLGQDYAEEVRRKRENDFLKQTYEHATSVAQAVQDVAQARRLMGMMRIREGEQQGLDPIENTFRNWNYFNNPADPKYGQNLHALEQARALREPPTAQATNLPGIGPVATYGNRLYFPPNPTKALADEASASFFRELTPETNPADLLKKYPMATHDPAVRSLLTQHALTGRLNTRMGYKPTLEEQAIIDQLNPLYIERAKSGGGGNPDQDALIDTLQEQLNAIEAKRKGITTQSVPSVGEVRKGYKFKGGDPSNPASWQKQ